MVDVPTPATTITSTWTGTNTTTVAIPQHPRRGTETVVVDTYSYDRLRRPGPELKPQLLAILLHLVGAITVVI